jgi:hypothetical protein
MRFPAIVAHDLEGRRYELPDELSDGPRLVMVAFHRWHTVVLAGIPDPAARRMTLTNYTDLRAFGRALDRFAPGDEPAS